MTCCGPPSGDRDVALVVTSDGGATWSSQFYAYDAASESKADLHPALTFHSGRWFLTWASVNSGNFTDILVTSTAGFDATAIWTSPLVLNNVTSGTGVNNTAYPALSCRSNDTESCIAVWEVINTQEMLSSSMALVDSVCLNHDNSNWPRGLLSLWQYHRHVCGALTHPNNNSNVSSFTLPPC